VRHKNQAAMNLANTVFDAKQLVGRNLLIQMFKKICNISHLKLIEEMEIEQKFKSMEK
jgi:molecular chaperone DnaK (HSP70)